MGIASGVLWIVFGVVYVLYRAFKERPGETMTGAVVFFVSALCLGVIGIIFKELREYDIVCAAVFAVVLAVVCITGMSRAVKRKFDDRDEARSKYQKALEIAKSEPINEEELQKFEKSFWAKPYGLERYPDEKRRYRSSKDKGSFRDMILKDYLENYRVYQIMVEMDESGGR